MAECLDAERRRFARILLERPAEVTDAAGRRQCRVLDVSLRGLLLEGQHAWRPAPGTPVAVQVELDDGGCCAIELTGVVAHVAAGRVGIDALRMDLDSAANLRRLVEVNLGDDKALGRELEAMLTGP